VNLAEWSLDPNLFESEKVAGPVPSLFAEDTAFVGLIDSPVHTIM